MVMVLGRTGPSKFKKSRKWWTGPSREEKQEIGWTGPAPNKQEIKEKPAQIPLVKNALKNSKIGS